MQGPEQSPPTAPRLPAVTTVVIPPLILDVGAAAESPYGRKSAANGTAHGIASLCVCNHL
jgi:hypothetical protein